MTPSQVASSASSRCTCSGPPASSLPGALRHTSRLQIRASFTKIQVRVPSEQEKAPVWLLPVHRRRRRSVGQLLGGGGGEGGRGASGGILPPSCFPPSAWTTTRISRGCLNGMPRQPSESGVRFSNVSTLEVMFTYSLLLPWGPCPVQLRLRADGYARSICPMVLP